jgi:hypothetical protein
VKSFDEINGGCTGAKLCPLKHTAVVRRERNGEKYLLNVLVKRKYNDRWTDGTDG